ncbi:hypothetical protein ACLOJK_041837 [Asimina triloba]
MGNFGICWSRCVLRKSRALLDIRQGRASASASATPFPSSHYSSPISRALTLFSAMGEEEGGQLRTEMESSSKRKLEEIQMAKQKAQEIVARLVNDAETKRPRFDDPSAIHAPPGPGLFTLSPPLSDSLIYKLFFFSERGVV